MKRAYRRLALELHPDKRAADVPEADANARFQELVEAFKVRARTRPSPSSRQILDLRPLARPTRSQRAPVPRRHPRVTRERIGSRLTVPDLRETLQVVGDAAEREAPTPRISLRCSPQTSPPRAAACTAATRGTRRHRPRDSGRQKSKRGRDDSTRRVGARAPRVPTFPEVPTSGRSGRISPSPRRRRRSARLPREIVVEVFGCVGVGRLLEVAARRADADRRWFEPHATRRAVPCAQISARRAGDLASGGGEEPPPAHDVRVSRTRWGFEPSTPGVARSGVPPPRRARSVRPVERRERPRDDDGHERGRRRERERGAERTARGGEGDAEGNGRTRSERNAIETVDEVGSNVALEVPVGVAEREEEEEEEETAAEGEFVRRFGRRSREASGDERGWSERRRRRTARFLRFRRRLFTPTLVFLGRTERARRSTTARRVPGGWSATRARDDRRALTLDTPSRMKDEPDVSFAPRSPPNLRRVRLKPATDKARRPGRRGDASSGCSRALSRRGTRVNPRRNRSGLLPTHPASRGSARVPPSRPRTTAWRGRVPRLRL